MNEVARSSRELKNFESLKIGLASTEKIKSWSHGEVKEPETINYRTLKPEPDGLFCEKIFGPQKDWECHCGKYKKVRFKGLTCDKCGVEITKSKVRRERMGHIELASPVSHIWYFKGIPSRMGLVLDMTPRNLEKVLYFASYIVLDPGETSFQKKEIISEQQYIETKDEFGDSFRAGIGAEAIRELLCEVDLEELSAQMKEELKKATSQKKLKLVRRLEVVEALRLSGNRPEWMIMELVPVIPPDLRPMVQLDGGRFATSDLNDLYRRVINRNKRLKKLLDLGAPGIIVRNEKRMLQEAVDALIDNGRRGKAVTGPGGRQLKSLSDMLKGKQGRFRQNLLGKRVDYSGRSVIVVGPELRFWQCGLPKTMALELFKPFIMKRLAEDNDINIRSAKKMVEEVNPKVWDVLEEVIHEHPVMLNRAPTLHRLGIQAFEPVLVEGKAIKLHPLACTAFNADFDGDQMAVHVPLSVEAQAEARFLMMSVNNILAPKDGSPITVPTQDMILGSYYMTHGGDGPGDDIKNSDRKPEEKQVELEKNAQMFFTDFDEMLMAYQTGEVNIHDLVAVRRFAGEDDHIGRRVVSTVGRFLFNQQIPQDLGYVEDREADPYSLEIDFLVGKKQLEDIIKRCFKAHGNTDTVLMLDAIKDQGYHYSTIAAVTIGVSDMEIPEEKEAIISEADERVSQYLEAYNNGEISEKERYEAVIDIWGKTTEKVSDAVMANLDSMNNLKIMADSGARGSKKQISQIGGMRGLMGNAAGKTVEIPIKTNFREGLSVLDYFVSTNGARKGLADTALRTADSGYLTRRLVDVSHNVIVREDDCGTDEGIEVRKFIDGYTQNKVLDENGLPVLDENGKEVIEKIPTILEPLKERIIGRTSLLDITHPKTGEILCHRNEEISEDIADLIDEAGIESVAIRSIMTCKSRVGICAKCYGRSLASNETVNIGESVGIMAAQSIGEPGTQLTMRTFHTGGVAGGDITNGLPRVEELFEARKPKGLAEICEADGVVQSIEPTKDNRKEVIVKGEEETSYIVPFNATLKVAVGDTVEAGDNITQGPLYPHDLLRLKGVEGVYQYLIKEVQKVYKEQGVDINDKHIEIIVSQMLSKRKVEDAGDTSLLPGGLYSVFEIEDANAEAEAQGLAPATSKVTLLGITKASLATNSFLSAASFQETTRVLTDAAIKGKNDKLQGLKENVIIGKLIPAGTGMKTYRNIDVDYGVNAGIIEDYYREKEALAAYEREQQEEAAMREREEAAAESAEKKEESITEQVEAILSEDQEVPQDPSEELADDMGIISAEEGSDEE